MNVKNLSTAVIMLTATAAVFPIASQADVTLSGQINRLVMSVDNGADDGIVHADNSNSGTRWRLKSSNDLGNGITAGVYFENQLQSNRSSAVNIGGLDSGGTGNVSGGQLSVRMANVWFKGDFGKITIGQGNGAANGSAEADKSGTGVIQYSGSNGDTLGGIEYGTSGITVGQATSNFDGLSRNDNIRYDGGSGPIGFAISLGNGDSTEFAIKYKMDLLEIRAAIWDTADAGGDVAGQAVSASWGGKTGLNLTASFAGNDSANDPENFYFKVGFKSGKNAYAVDFNETSDKAGNGIDGSGFSVAWVHNMAKGVQTYVSYRAESLDGAANDDDVTALIAGARVKF